MRGDGWLKVASGIWILFALGAVIALAKGVHVTAVIETVGYPWILLAMLFDHACRHHLEHCSHILEHCR
jgi:hypothetical protein